MIRIATIDPMPGAVMYLGLPSITFHPAGRVTARYAPLPEDFDPVNYLYIEGVYRFYIDE